MSDSTTQNGKSPRPAVTSATLRKRRWVLVGAVLLVPFAMEAAVRAAGRTGLVMHTEVGKRQQRAQPPLTHRLKKGARVEVTYAPRNGPPIRTAVMTINKLGMRGALPRGGRPLVACIGDSHTFGYGVSDHETWPVVLEKELLKKTPQIEVINFGVGGYGPHQELVRLRDDALPYEPDIVLWQWFMNDIDPRSVKEHRTALQRRVFRLAQPFRTDWVLGVREKSVLIDLALHSAYVWARNNSMVAEEVVKAAEGSERWNRALDALREARDQSETRGAKFAIVVHPIMVAKGDGFASSVLDAMVVDFCEREGIAVIDLTSALDPSDAAVLRNSDLDYHPSPTCYALVGPAIARALESLGWVGE